MLIDTLNTQGYFPAKKNNYINIANVDGLLWRVESRGMYPDPYRANGKHSAYDLAHQAFHVLGALRFGWTYRGRPKVGLLIEALAGASQLYFEAGYLARSPGAYKRSRYLRHCVAHSKGLKLPIVTLLNRAMADPFQAYKNLVKDQLKLSFILLDYCKSFYKHGKFRLKASVRSS